LFFFCISTLVLLKWLWWASSYRYHIPLHTPHTLYFDQQVSVYFDQLVQTHQLENMFLFHREVWCQVCCMAMFCMLQFVGSIVY
jgi:hypothetical protein